MKQGIHPNYVECTVRCSCGNTFKTHATVPELVVELCNACHPFYTGQQKFVDNAGRVQRFADKFGGAAAKLAEKKAAEKAARAAKQAELEAAAKIEREKKAAEKARRTAEYAAKAAAEASVAQAAQAEAAAAPEAE